MGITQFAKKNAVKSKKDLNAVHELSPSFAAFALFCASLPGASLFFFLVAYLSSYHEKAINALYEFA